MLWRYGPLSLVLVGLSLLGFGASGLCGTAISLALLPLGFVCFIAGVALPRIEGMFTAGPHGISGRMLAVHEIDTMYTATAPALAAPQQPVGGQHRRARLDIGHHGGGHGRILR